MEAPHLGRNDPGPCPVCGATGTDPCLRSGTYPRLRKFACAECSEPVLALRPPLAGYRFVHGHHREWTGVSIVEEPDRAGIGWFSL